MTAGGWGIGSWGVSPWGTGEMPAAPGAGAQVYASGDRTVRLLLPFEPQHRYPTQVGDALNPKTWVLRFPATGRQVHVLSVREVRDTEYELRTLELLANDLTELELRAPDLLYANGAPVLGFLATFGGQSSLPNSTQQLQTTAAGYALTDVANPQTPNSPTGGTLVVTSAGEYRSVTGTALLKKLIVRRLQSNPGDFFHLPAYGAGLREKVPMAQSDLRRLAKRIEEQVLLEPEVEAVAVSLTLQPAAGILVVNLVVKVTPSGEQVQIGLSIPGGGVAL